MLKIVIPRIKATIAYILDGLEELSREEFYRFKKIINVKQKRRENCEHPSIVPGCTACHKKVKEKGQNLPLPLIVEEEEVLPKKVKAREVSPTDVKCFKDIVDDVITNADLKTMKANVEKTIPVKPKPKPELLPPKVLEKNVKLPKLPEKPVCDEKCTKKICKEEIAIKDAIKEITTAMDRDLHVKPICETCRLNRQEAKARRREIEPIEDDLETDRQNVFDNTTQTTEVTMDEFNKVMSAVRMVKSEMEPLLRMFEPIDRPCISSESLTTDHICRVCREDSSIIEVDRRICQDLDLRDFYRNAFKIEEAHQSANNNEYRFKKTIVASTSRGVEYIETEIIKTEVTDVDKHYSQTVGVYKHEEYRKSGFNNGSIRIESHHSLITNAMSEQRDTSCCNYKTKQKDKMPCVNKTESNDSHKRKKSQKPKNKKDKQD